MDRDRFRLEAPQEPEWLREIDADGWRPGWSRPPRWPSLAHPLGRLVGWEEARSDVLRESQGRVAVAGRRGTGKRALLAQLCGWELEPEPTLAAIDDFGFWTVVDLPEKDERLALDGSSIWEALLAADLVLLVSGRPAPDPETLRWAGRIRANGQPLLLVLAGAPVDAVARRALQRRLGQLVIGLLGDGESGPQALLEAMVAASPALLVPLGRELPGWRHWAATRLVAQTALTCGLWGLEPVPLLDLPVQVAAQAGLAQRLLAMYGWVAPSPARREALLVVGSGLALRLGAEQALKALPVAGWLLAGTVSAGGTWLLGQALVASLERSARGEAGLRWVPRFAGRPRLLRWRPRRPAASLARLRFGRFAGAHLPGRRAAREERGHGS